MVTGGRADYGLLRPLMRRIQKTAGLDLQLIATGSHFAKEFGLTYQEIKKDGFQVDGRVPMKTSFNTCRGICKNMASGIHDLSKALSRLQPDIIVILGDRFEAFCAAASATIFGVPIAHLHGGELTEGAYDDAFRHAITKLSHLHFPTTSVYRKRIIQMGEEPQRVFQVGSLGIENVLSQKMLKRKKIEKILGIHLKSKNLLITYHPTTLEPGQAGAQIKILLKALETSRDTGLIFTIPGADKENKIIYSAIKKFVKNFPNAYVFRSLGSRLYLSLMREVDAVVGNSSSGILEAPSLKKPVVNVGNRQKGRIRLPNIIDCKTSVQAIKKSIQLAFSKDFKKKCKKIKNTFGHGKTSIKIVKILKQQTLIGLKNKKFFNLSK